MKKFLKNLCVCVSAIIFMSNMDACNAACISNTNNRIGIEGSTGSEVTKTAKTTKTISSVSGGNVVVNKILNIPVLEYHSISTKTSKDGLTLSKNDFKRQLYYLLNQGYKAISFSDLQMAYALNDKSILPPKPMLITFDDGYADNYKNAFPILKMLNVKANVNIIFAYVDKKPNFLNSSQIKTMINSGLIEIGCHTYHMHDQKDLKRGKNESFDQYRKRLLKDFVKSKYVCYQKLNYNSFIFALPYGIDNYAITQDLQKAGFDVILTSTSGIFTFGGSTCYIPRIETARYIKPESVTKAIATYSGYDYKSKVIKSISDNNFRTLLEGYFGLPIGGNK